TRPNPTMPTLAMRRWINRKTEGRKDFFGLVVRPNRPSDDSRRDACDNPKNQNPKPLLSFRLPVKLCSAERRMRHACIGLDGERVEQTTDTGIRAVFGFDGAGGYGQGLSGAEESAEGAVERVLRLFGDAGAPEADAVQRAHAGAVAGDDD